MAVEVYINFNGNCREAVEYYAEVFTTDEPMFMTFGDSPMDSEFPLTDTAKTLIMHTELNICGSKVMFSDTPPGMPLVQGNNISLIVKCPSIDEIKNIYDHLKEGGEVQMELQETFWSKCYGFVVDKFGIGWQLSYEEEKE
jgi:PhnB protein